MNTLIITPISPPVPGRDVHGIYQRLGMFVRVLGHASTRVQVLHFVPPESPMLTMDLQDLSEEQSLYWGVTVKVLLVPIGIHSKTFRAHYMNGLLSPFRQPDFGLFCGPAQVAAVAQAIRSGPRQPDVVFVQGLAGMGPVLLGREAPRRLFFDLNDIEHKARLRLALQPPLRLGKLIYAAHALMLVRMEAEAIRKSDGTFVCSDRDFRHLRRIGLGKSVHVIPNAIQMPAEDVVAAWNPSVLRSLLFIGDYRYVPNQLAAERLVRKVWPLIHSKCPDARLTIAGQGSECLAGFADPPSGVTFPGFVPSLDELYAETRIVCCPIMAGGGTRLKLIEAAGYAKPIVSTRIGAEGLSLRDGVEILLCDDDASFANACVTLLGDATMCRRLGQAARTRAQALYDVTAIQKQIAAFIE